MSRTPPHTYAPRPSISPLSTASKATKQSPIATRDAMMEDADLQEEIERNTAAANGVAAALEDDDGSSELSEPDDDIEEHTHDHGIEDELSDEEEATAQKSLEVDSEAETERLDQTPHRQRKHADALGKTPSKLSQAATAEDDLSEPPSPLPTGPGAASSTSTVATAGEYNPLAASLKQHIRATNNAAEGQKRRRSGSDDSSLTSADSDLGQSPRKRSRELNEDAQEKGRDIAEQTEQQEEDLDASADTPRQDEVAEPSAVPRKGPKGKKGKQKGRPPKEPVEEIETEQVEEHGEQETEAVEEDPAKKEEAQKSKRDAMELFESVAKQHRAFQELLNRERLADVARQLEMLEEKDCVHPEYRAQVACVDARLEKQQREARAYHHYKLRCIRERTLGERSQLHSQYFQQARDLRQDALEKLGETAYAIQNQRRLESIVPENDDAYVFKYNPKKSQQIRQQAKYNQEVSVLSGMAKHVGFPAAPEIKGAEGGALDDDLKAMKISKRAAQPAPHRPVYIPPANNSTLAQNERLAHEQFIEKNAWAQPQGPLHTWNTPNISHTPDWADQPFNGTGGSAKHLIRTLSGQPQGGHRTGSPYATPLPQKRAPIDLSSSGTVPMNNSDGPDIPPSSVQPAPPTSQRISLLNDHPSTSGPQTSPLTVPKQRHHHHHNGPHERETGNPREKELTGFRNISNISGASTIDNQDTHDRDPSSSHHHHSHHQHGQRQPHDVPPGPYAHLYANRDLSSGAGRNTPLSHILQGHLRHEDSAPLQAFDTSAFHRHGEPHGPNGTPLASRAGGGLSTMGSRTQTPARDLPAFTSSATPFGGLAGFRPGLSQSAQSPMMQRGFGDGHGREGVVFGTPSATAGLTGGPPAGGGGGGGLGQQGQG